ncbi:OmpA family protein [Pedobacter cryoconitis]|uniref:OOP family OmpA-OmpF porin n=1 Tax=Pedobacter cryoconitis TaxID=188932 RepID=A0A7X0MI71_9SPHI|nr:OmpA family protein [Pedobacter cryoconitis]MBB6498230.1 OOP family OmpA-OmpF porin [Pedobacter cryoconitis]
MKLLRTPLLLAGAGLLVFSLQSCKTKKIVAKPNPPVVAAKPVEKPVEAPVEQKAETTPVVEKPDFNFNNIQFEFNSDVLKTASIETLDKAAREMKKDPSVKFVLNGHSSAEGTVAHNMSLSVDRANAVRSYLMNAGINGNNLAVKGFGATQPVSANTTDEGKALNRRVELKIAQ